MTSAKASKRDAKPIIVCAMFVFAIGLGLPVMSSGSVVAEEPYYQMVIGVAQKPDTLNVFSMTLSISYTINFLVYDTLNSVEPDFSPGPQLAESWETSEDKLTWTFHLDPDAMWQDDEPVTADDVKFTFDLILQNEKEGALWIDYLSNVDSVDVIDTHTVEVVTTVPKATMLTMMVPILPKHLWEDVPADDIDKVDPWDPDYFPDGPIGSGPLILESYDSVRGEIVMLKNPDYFIDVCKVDEVLWKAFGDETVMVNALWSGDIDVAMDVPASLWDTTLTKPGLEGQATSALSFYELGINCASEEWRTDFPKASTNLETTNLSVRQAIAMATNKTDIVDRILRGLAQKGESIIPTATPFWHYYVPEEDVWDYHIVEANALLNASGYIDTDGDGIRQNSSASPTDNDAELDFTLYFRKGYKDEKASAEAIHESLLLIGINTELKEVSEGILWNTWLNLEWDLFIWGWDTDVDPNFMLSVFTISQYPVDPQDGTKWGDALWVNEEYEQMYLDQQEAVDKYERQTIVHNMQKLLYNECPYVVLYYPMGLHAYDNVEYTNYPDMVKYPGSTPGTMWFFFEVTPTAEYSDSFPPTNVDAGADQKCTVGETLPFSGYAEDQDNLETELNWTWSFSEPDETMNVSYGKDVTYKFEQKGNVTVTLIVTDPDLQSASDSLTVNVTDISETAGWLKGLVLDQNSDPLASVSVNASGSIRLTIADGTYSMPLEAGGYSLTVSKSGYTEETSDVTIVTGETTWANFTLSATAGTLEGVVRDADTDDPIDSANVTITYGTTTRTFSTNAEGEYEFGLVPAGAVNVSVSKTGYVTNVTEVTIVAGETVSHDVYLSEEKSGGSSSVILIAAGVLAAVIVAVAALYLIRKKKSGGEMEPPAPEGQ